MLPPAETWRPNKMNIFFHIAPAPPLHTDGAFNLTNETLMRRLVPFLLIIAGILPQLQAQEGVKIGLRFSPLVSFTSITDENGNIIPGTTVAGKAGFSYGLHGTYGFGPNYGLYSGVHIVRKGFSRTDNLDTLSIEQNITATTVEIPIALRGRSNEIGNGVYLNGLFGVSLDVRAGYRNTYTGANPVSFERGDGEIRNSSLINPITASFLIGGGADIDLGNAGMANVGLSFHQGLININSQSNFGNNEVITISYLALDAAYVF